MAQSVWNDELPRIWYGCVVVERADGETDYFYGYSSLTEDVPDVNLLVPLGAVLLTYELCLTPFGRDHMWRNDDTWAFEAQRGSDAVTYDEYDSARIV